MESRELPKEFKEFLQKEGKSYEEFIDEICNVLKKYNVKDALTAEDFIELAIAPYKLISSNYRFISDDVLEKCNLKVDEDIKGRSVIARHILDKNYELSDSFKKRLKLEGITQDEYVEKIVGDMLICGAVSADEIILYCKKETDNLEDLASLVLLIDKKLENYGHKKQTFIDFARMNLNLANNARLEADYAKRYYDGDLRSDVIHDSLVKEGEYLNIVDRIRPLLKIVFEDSNNLVKITFGTEYGDNVDDYELRLMNGDTSPDMDIITMHFPEYSEYYGYSWYYDRKLLKKHEKYEGLVYIELPSDMKIAIFDGELIKYISSVELKEEMMKVEEQDDDDYEEDEYDEDYEYYLEPEKRTISKSFQEYLDNKGTTLDEYINEICDYLQKNNIQDSVKICDTVANKKFLPSCATSYDFYEVLIPRIFNKLHITDDKKQN